MTRYADPERCPDCSATMPYGARSCPACGLSLDGPLAARLFATLSTADEILVELRSRVAAPPATTRPRELLTGDTPPGTSVAGGGLGLLERPAPGQTAADSGTIPPGPPTGQDEGRPHGGMSAASVPKILLGLGALCLLVAALVFLAVTWSAMGVGGRTATLVAFTAVAAGLTTWSARRDLRAAAESLGVVALGLLAFDLLGARDAGWLGTISTPTFLVVLGAVLVLAGSAAALAVRRTPAGALTGAEVVAALGLVTAVAGITASDRVATSAGLVAAVLVAGGAASIAHLLRLPVLTTGATLVSGATWLALVLSSTDRALGSPSLRELWLGLESWPLVASAAIVGGLALVPRLPLAARLVAAGAAALVTAGLLLAPVTDEAATPAALAGVALVAATAALTWFSAQRWRPAFSGVLVVGVVVTGIVAWSLALAATGRVADAVGALWSGTAGDTLATAIEGPETLAGWTLPLLVLAAAAALVALARTFAWADRVLAPVADLDIVVAAAVATVLVTLGLYAFPLWLVLGVLLAAAVAYTAWSLHGDRALPLGLGALFLAPALVVSLHAEALTLLAALVILVLAAVVHLRWPSVEVAVVAGGVVAAALAGVLWTLGALADGRPEWTAVFALGSLTLLVLGLPYVDAAARRNEPATLARLGTEAGALLAAAVVAVAGVATAPVAGQATWLAVYLTIAGATASALALLRPDRREAGWLGGLLLAAATWVRLADLGVEEPEAYTLPSALALLAVGLHRLRSTEEAGTFTALTPGLVLALVPSLLWVLVDPVTLRSLLLGAACLALVVGGVRVRWSAPLVYGAVVGTLLVLRHATPIAEAVPRWALIGTAGVLLVALGITWERRLREARAVAGYVRALR